MQTHAGIDRVTTLQKRFGTHDVPETFQRAFMGPLTKQPLNAEEQGIVKRDLETFDATGQLPAYMLSALASA